MGYSRVGNVSALAQVEDLEAAEGGQVTQRRIAFRPTSPTFTFTR